MPFTSQQIKAIAAKKTRELGKAGAKRYMHKLKHESIKNYGYFTKDKSKVAKRNA